MRLSGQPADLAADAVDAVAAELRLGMEAGSDPLAAFGDDGASGVTTTQSSSWWNFLRCATCGHTFRRGDRVLVDPAARTVAHLDPGLACGTVPGEAPGGPGDGAAAGRDRAEFAAGLLGTWAPTAPVTRIGAGDWRLPRPGNARRLAPACLYCGHTFRPGEYVVACPCHAAAGLPPACGAAVHRDPAAGLPCWDNWRPAGQLTVCPTTTARL